jgi:hypothetical protein
MFTFLTLNKFSGNKSVNSDQNKLEFNSNSNMLHQMSGGHYIFAKFLLAYISFTWKLQEITSILTLSDKEKCFIFYVTYMWNVRSSYRAGSSVTVSKELSKYKLHLVGVQEVR